MKSESSCRSKFISLGTTLKNALIALSLGKYQTTLYHNQRAYQGSICGGLFTAILGIGFLVFTITTFRNIFVKDHYNLDLRATPILTYTKDKNRTIEEEQEQCPSCEPVTVGDVLSLIKTFSIIILPDKNKN